MTLNIAVKKYGEHIEAAISSQGRSPLLFCFCIAIDAPASMAMVC
ncbi:MAG TPA: hypothetical protein PKZ76_15050 [Xanthomonadaceae bacterium]|nr:hypothetical protein [Xanthomonadaceae bacterium]